MSVLHYLLLDFQTLNFELELKLLTSLSSHDALVLMLPLLHVTLMIMLPIRSQFLLLTTPMLEVMISCAFDSAVLYFVLIKLNFLHQHRGHFGAGALNAIDCGCTHALVRRCGGGWLRWR
jgi:hypothetical protein